MNRITDILKRSSVLKVSRLAVRHSSIVTIGPSHGIVTIGQGQNDAEVVRPSPRLAWDEKGWSKETNKGTAVKSGPYRVYDRIKGSWREFDGCIREDGRKTAVYIYEPPAGVRQHPKGACLMLTKTPPWFYMNWHVAAKNVDDSILYVETVLWESLNIYVKK